MLAESARLGEERGEKRGEKRGKQQGQLLGQQQTLIQVLGHKFGAIPDAVVQRIEATFDPTQLKRWLDQALDANALTELDFSEPRPPRKKKASGKP